MYQIFFVKELTGSWYLVYSRHGWLLFADVGVNLS